MSTRTALGWQTMLADLSLILFMVTAAAMAEPTAPKPAPAPAPTPTASADLALADPARSEPLAIWREAPGAPPLADWLASQSPDARQRLSITVPYRPGEQAKAAARGAALAAAAGPAGRQARVILEPGSGSPVAALSYDRAVPH